MTTESKTPTQVQSDDLKRLRDAIEKKAGKTTEELYAEREKRITDAIELREPDRVPVIMAGGYFAARYGGLTASAAYYDIPAYREAIKKTAIDIEPDQSPGAAATGGAGRALEILDAKQTAWPGGTLPPDVGHQFVEGEYMKADEYDLFLSDPTDFTLRYYLPRIFGALEPLAQLPSLTSGAGNNAMGLTQLFLRPEFRKVGEVLTRAALEQQKWIESMNGFDDEMASLGFPPPSFGTGSVSLAPFDVISDRYRGMRGSMLDMYRRPEKLLAACDKVLEMQPTSPMVLDASGRGTKDPAMSRKPVRAFMPLHRGAEGFMSREQFETFYWPGLKKAIMANIDMGYIASPFFEGHFDDRLEYLLELPKGKVVCRFEQTDMARAKAILGDHFCIEGNVPSSLLQLASPQEVEDYCKNLIKTCAKGGGFILSHGSSIDEAKPANVKAMVDSVKKYGWY